MKISIKQVQTFLQVLQKKFYHISLSLFLGRLLKNKVTYRVAKKISIQIRICASVWQHLINPVSSFTNGLLT